MRTIVTVTKNGNCPALIIPTGVRRALGWEAGTKLAVFVDRGMLICVSLDTHIDQLQKHAANVVSELELTPAP